MRKITVFLILLILFWGCTQKEKVKPLDPANMDLTVKPGDNFFLYANGTWLKNNPVPPEYSRWGVMEYLLEKNIKDLKLIFEEASLARNAQKGSNIQKIGDFYATGMDSAKLEEDGVKPLENYFEKIENIQTTDDIQQVMADFQSEGINTLFYLLAEKDNKEKDLVITWLYQGGLGLPDRDYYTNTDQRSKDIREEYVSHVTKMFELIGANKYDATQSAKKVMKMETQLAEASMTLKEQRNPIAIYNKMPVKKLDRMTPHFNWRKYFSYIGLEKAIDINVAQPIFFKEASKMMGKINIDDWKTYLRWHLINNTAAYLSDEFANLDFEFYQKYLSGTEKRQPRWKRVLRSTSSHLGEIVGQFYVERFFPPEAKTKALDLVMNLKAAFKDRIKNTEWMSEETKQRALEKLEAFGVKIGYPDKWTDYSTLEIEGDSYLANVLRANHFEFKRDIEKIGKPVDRNEWEMSPQTVNAYYHPFLNEVVFPAAILQPPFFNHRADDPINYGAIGVVIGHEMTHGFDDQGRHYDKDGNLNDWWTKEDAENFERRADVLVEQFNNFVALDTAHIDGKLTLGENIADLGGVNIAFDAYQKAKQTNPPKPLIDGFTPEQRFFLSYAQIWRNNIRDENLLLRLKTDVHSPGRFRVLGPLPNALGFYEAFDIQEDDAMFLPENRRAKIW